MNYRSPTLCASLAIVAIGLSLGGAALAASTGSTRVVARPQTLFASSRRIYSFALGAHRITWISHNRRRGRYRSCEMYVRTLRTGRTLRAPVPSAGCGLTPPPDWAPQVPVLTDGVAAWVTRRGSGISERYWKIATITGGEAKARIVEDAAYGCPGVPACLFPHLVGKAAAPVPPPFARPSLAGKGSVLVYSAGAANLNEIRRIVGRHTVPFAVLPGLATSLAVGGGAVEARSTALDAGDGCGCLDSPTWSPDGSQIAYLHSSSQSAALAVMNADGSGRHDLTAPAVGYARSFSWSPDGRQIAYAGADGKIVVVNVDGSGANVVGLGYDPVWSPDGSEIAFANAGCSSTTAAISVMNPDGTNLHQLTSFTSGCIDPTGMAWSSDGTRIAFSSANSSGGETLEMMNSDGTNAHPLGTDTLVTRAGCSGCFADEPSWSPNGSQIVFRAYDYTNTDRGLWVIGADGSGLHQLTQGPDDHPSWSPSGQTIVFGSERNDPYGPFGSPELYLVDPDGSSLRPLSFTKPAAFEQRESFYSASGEPLPSLPGVPTLAGNVAAVGSTNQNGGHEITLFDATTGAQLEVVEVGGTGSDEFEIAGADSHWVVFRLGVIIYGLNTDSHHVVRLTTAANDPVGLTVAGRRVAWAENTITHGRGRIRALELPS